MQMFCPPDFNAWRLVKRFQLARARLFGSERRSAWGQMRWPGRDKVKGSATWGSKG